MENKNNVDTNQKAWVVAVDMGYGHQRTAYPLRDLAFGKSIVNANNYEGIVEKDRKFWEITKSSYEFISRLRSIPFIGIFLFLFLDSFQKILGYYPKRDLSKENFSGKTAFSFIKRGWGRDLIEKLEKHDLPLVTTFFTPAFMAEKLNYPNDIYCVICDSDIARAWVSLDPRKSKITYFAPCTWARDRLKLYGVAPEKIILTGYPLPKENLGGPNLEILKKDLGYRILNLDPTGRYRKLYGPLIKSYLGQLPKMPNHPLTIMFSIGGAGAQKDLALSIFENLKEKILARELRFIISVGIKEDLKKFFTDTIKEISPDGWVSIVYGSTINEYFEKFNKALRTTDILMTKPSELSFYAALGIPIIIEPSIGSQEDFNRRWLMHIGAAMLQENPGYTDQWLFDMLRGGDLAEVAMQGFVEIEKLGTYNIEKIVAGKN